MLVMWATTGLVLLYLLIGGIGMLVIWASVTIVFMQNSPMWQLDVEVIRDAGPMNAGETMVAFLKDPDGYEIELLSKKF
jgi:lactoylglutathione lyase